MTTIETFPCEWDDPGSDYCLNHRKHCPKPVPFWICPACGTFWSKVPMPTDPALRVNDGVRVCLDCKRAQWARDDEWANARADAYYG